MPESLALNLPVEGLVKSHNALVNLLTENFALKAALDQARAYIAELESVVEELRESLPGEPTDEPIALE